MSTKIIKSTPTSLKEHLALLFAHRRLIFVFALRDVKKKYVQTYLGALWGVFQPLIALIVFTFFFGLLLKVDTSPLPYPVFVFSGLIFWNNFSSIANNSGTALLESQEFINKFYFPKLVLLFSKVISAFIEFVMSFMLLLLLMVIFKTPLSIKIVFLPLFILYNAVIALSIGIWLSSLTIRFRDLFQVIPYLIGFGIFVTPVFFPSTLIPDNFHFLIYINPIAGVIEGARWAMWGGTLPSLNYLWGLLPVFILLLGGLLYFFSVEDKLTDFI